MSVSGGKFDSIHFQSTFLLRNLTNIPEAMEVMYFFGGCIMLFVKYGAFLYYREVVEQVKIDLQKNFDKSEYKTIAQN